MPSNKEKKSTEICGNCIPPTSQGYEWGKNVLRHSVSIHGWLSGMVLGVRMEWGRYKYDLEIWREICMVIEWCKSVWVQKCASLPGRGRRLWGGDEIWAESARTISREKRATWGEATAHRKAQWTENNSQLCRRWWVIWSHMLKNDWRWHKRRMLELVWGGHCLLCKGNWALCCGFKIGE